MRMIFTVLKNNDLTPLMELDDYISAIWNNKYFSTGDFEIVMQTTQERIQKVVRDNYISLNDTAEIAYIDSIQFSEDEDKGALMTVKGYFMQGLLDRRIVWENTRLLGNVEDKLQSLINENALAPSIDDRKLIQKIFRSSKYYTYGDAPAYPIPDHTYIDEIQLIGKTRLAEGQQEYTNDHGKISDRPINAPSTDFDLSYYYDMLDPDTFYLMTNDTSSGRWIYSNPNDEGNYSTAYIKHDSCRVIKRAKPFSIQQTVTAEIIEKATEASLIDEGGILQQYGLAYYKIGRAGNIVIKGALPDSLKDTISEDIKAFSNGGMEIITKEEFNNGGYGLAIFDNTLNWRMYVNQTVVDQSKDLYDAEIVMLRLIALAFFGYNPTEFTQIALENLNAYNASHLVIYTLKEAETLDAVTYCNGAQIGLTAFFAKWDDFKYFSNTTTNKSADLYLVWTYEKEDVTEYLELGNKAGSTDNINIQTRGDNLLEKVENVLELSGLGLKARYDKTAKKVYIDFYAGEDRTGNIVFSENLDNLASYDVTLANPSKNVALVYSEKDDKEYTGIAGNEAGLQRRETFINKSDIPYVISADYQQQLIADGELSLLSFTVAIESEIDTRAYDYRMQYNLGDIVIINIRDLNISYNVRILEVREYQDETGYSIDLVLGE